MTISTEDHWRHFSDFCRWEVAFGGPSSQLATVVKMTEGEPEHEKLWRAFCYIAVYNVPYGEVIWRLAPRHEPSFSDWVEHAFAEKHITTRFERRCLRRADWMNEYFVGVRKFMEDWGQLRAKCETAASPEAAYELTWDRVLEIPRVGRYIAIRTVELFRRYGLPVRTPNIRPRDAKTSRSTLGVLYPGSGLESRDNSLGALNAVNVACADALIRLEDLGVIFDYYQLQVTLCEYRQSWKSRKQYPGRSLDSELAYARRAEKEWGYKSGIWAARAALFPDKCLGEISGWEGTRKDTGQVLADYGYTWSDLLYDYGASHSNMASPIRWPQ